MKESYKVLVKVYQYKGNEYVIVKGIHDGIIRAINYKYVDSSGNATKALNGLEMFCDRRANTVNTIIERINYKHDLDGYLADNGIDRSDNEAFIKAIMAFNI